MLILTVGSFAVWLYLRLCFVWLIVLYGLIFMCLLVFNYVWCVLFGLFALCWLFVCCILWITYFVWLDCGLLELGLWFVWGGLCLFAVLCFWFGFLGLSVNWLRCLVYGCFVSIFVFYMFGCLNWLGCWFKLDELFTDVASFWCLILSFCVL